MNSYDDRAVTSLDVGALEGAVPRLVERLREVRETLTPPEQGVFERIVQAATRYMDLARQPAQELVDGPFVKPLLAAATPQMKAEYHRLSDPLPGVESRATVPAGDGEAITDGQPIQLVEKLEGVRTGLDEAGLLGYRLLLACATRGLGRGEHLPTGDDFEALKTVLRSLAPLQATGARYVGHPGFVTDALLAELGAEAGELRAGAAWSDHYFKSSLGPCARAFAESEELAEFVSGFSWAPMGPTGSGKYLYVDQPGTGIGPHFHTEPFAINVELKLRHDCPDGAPARMVLFPPDAPTQRVSLRPGRMVLWFAGGTPHAREDTKPGENMSVVSLWFEPLMRPQPETRPVGSTAEPRLAAEAVPPGQ